ncbi:alpha/beta fold hydrolase [Nocardioides sp. URHA0032]|uniref:alpha/beta fold hydrolase n=1 Tax=Nocardioides sp. URHA0032 TaxID=1380388 RepID=UPI0006851992|nr:alpha/beta fold hydrolase [Nocardioides sp. URHA0032]
MTRPLLVLGPSLGTSATALWGACAELLARDFEVLAWDLPGHGSAREVPGPVTIAGLATAVLDRVDGPFFHAGDSAGGAVGLQLALDAPDRVRGVVALCTGARIGTEESWAERIAQVRASGTPGLVSASAGRWFGTGFLEREPARASALLHALSDADDEGYVAVCRALATFDVRDRLGEIGVPVLAVAGEQDTVCPPDLLREVADGVLRGQYAELPGVAHLAPAEAPEAVADLIREHCLEGAR